MGGGGGGDAGLCVGGGVVVALRFDEPASSANRTTVVECLGSI